MVQIFIYDIIVSFVLFSCPSRIRFDTNGMKDLINNRLRMLSCPQQSVDPMLFFILGSVSSCLLFSFLSQNKLLN